MSTSAKDKTENLDGKHNFQAEVTRLLDIVARSLYSEKEIFLRELVSNASDACDKLRYETLTNPSLVEGDSELRIIISYDSKKRILSITDNGIGMSNQELIDNLGTIARSGTAAFVENIEQSDDVSSNLIGQFGVGFYSAFMVADNVLVTSRRAGSEAGGIWESDGKGSFTITETEKADKRGTTVELHLSKNEKEFLDDSRIINIIKTYSDHISIPIILRKEDNTEEQINSASALWTRPSNEISEDNYKEFYNHIGRMYDQPWMTIHNRVEGKIEYTNLLFIPSSQPFDLFQPDRKTNIKLYVRRVFITDDCEELIPAWLRFVRGLVDSEDLPLNISREMLQHNPVLTKIKAGLVKRIIRELKKKIKKDPEGYLSFWGNFGAVLKEGLYESEEYRKDLLEISKFPSTDKENLITLAEYVSDMAEGQEDIFYFSGSNLEAVSSSPQLEAFRKKKINVLLMVDPVDEFWLPTINEYDGKKFRSVSRGDIEIDKIGSYQETKKDNTAKDNENLSSLTALLKITLVDAVKDVRESNRLTDSAVCLVADEDDMDMHLERLLRQHKQVETASKRILEINPTHPMILDLAKTVSKKGTAATAELEDVAWLLLDQALIIEGESPPDPGAFAQRMSSIIGKGLNE
ncbi:MAG: molecular chaperone HtpG [Alphaproteobacteria bacterium]|nr:molecular chaperone HtpG [Alphaproteobacteria bacterium]PPR13930.1 MAG: Chaperone protein HtpG [Alphaproteobacteria bacterium MarineAlpha12_Bin1]|tara:strand:- start:17918 stop:19825 length:1908 start_codon:yes stop_codon:yes gene_type:complete